MSGGLDDMVISLYAHGMSVRDIICHLRQVYGTELSPESVSRITDAVLEEVKAWQSRPLDPVYAVVFLDAIVVKVRDNQVVQNKPAYVAVGVDADGEKHVLGIWLAAPRRRPRPPARAPASGPPSPPTSATAASATSSSPASTGWPASPTPSPPRSRPRSCSGASSISSGTRCGRSPGGRRRGREGAPEDLHRPDRRGRLRRPRRLHGIARDGVPDHRRRCWRR